MLEILNVSNKLDDNNYTDKNCLAVSDIKT